MEVHPCYLQTKVNSFTIRNSKALYSLLFTPKHTLIKIINFNKVKIDQSQL